jgi:hypothetical protein
MHMASEDNAMELESPVGETNGRWTMIWSW